MNFITTKYTTAYATMGDNYELESELIYSDDDQHEYIEHHADIAPPYPLGPEDWQSWYSDDLWNMWNMIFLYSQESGVGGNVLSDCTFSDFCSFLYSKSRHGASYRNGFNWHY